MGGLRSRILRTLQSFPNAAAQSNLLLPPPPGASPSPSPQPPATPCGHLQEPAPQEQEALVNEAGPAPEVPGGGTDGDDKENVSPGVTPRKAKKTKFSSDYRDGKSSGLGEDPAADDTGATCYRRPDLASATLFDPDLLVAFRRAVDAYAQALEVSKRRDDDDIDDGVPGEGGGGGPGVEDPLEAFELRCPPGGERAVVLYTTSIRGVRKTFEECARVRRLLDGLRVAFLERDISMHAPYREELRSLLCSGQQDQDGGSGGEGGGGAFPVPPRLFVDGRYIGGAEEVVALHERSQLRPVFRRAPRRAAGEGPCAVCGGAWFVVCGGCSGSQWLHDAAASACAVTRVRCSACNENGLVPCPLCS